MGAYVFGNSFVLKRKDPSIVGGASPIYLTLFKSFFSFLSILFTTPSTGFFFVSSIIVGIVFIDFGQSASSVFVFLVGRRVFFWGSKHLYDKSVSLSVQRGLWFARCVS